MINHPVSAWEYILHFLLVAFLVSLPTTRSYLHTPHVLRFECIRSTVMTPVLLLLNVSLCWGCLTELMILLPLWSRNMLYTLSFLGSAKFCTDHHISAITFHWYSHPHLHCNLKVLCKHNLSLAGSFASRCQIGLWQFSLLSFPLILRFTWKLALLFLYLPGATYCWLVSQLTLLFWFRATTPLYSHILFYDLRRKATRG